MAFPLSSCGIWLLKYLHSSCHQVQRNLKRHEQSRQHTSNQTQIQTKRDDLDLVNVDFVSSHTKSSRSGGMLQNFEDNKAVIKMIIKGRSPNDETRVPHPQSCS